MTETPAPNAAPLAAASFEAAMAELEQIVRQLEEGRVDLESSIALYERGAQLQAHCQKKLDAAEQRVRQIVRDDAGAATGVETSPLEREG